MQFGVNGWVWTSPVNTQAFEELAPKVKKMGFDLFEFGIESTSDLDYARAAKVAKDNGLAISVCAAMGPDRDLIHEDGAIRQNGMEYVRHCIDAASRTWSGRSTARSAAPGSRPATSGSATLICSSIS
jgi:D-psicose/D-tagatose/L-ribulose 3-epimerase